MRQEIYLTIARQLKRIGPLLLVGGLGVALIIVGALAGRSAEGGATTPLGATARAATIAALHTSRPLDPSLLTVTPTAAVQAGQPPDCTLDAVFQEDVTIPDNTFIEINEPFTKTWRLLNEGTCAWTSGYELVFAAGAQMSGPDVTSVSQTAPGETVDISIGLVAPPSRGAYRGDWQMRSSEGEQFGDLIYVQIIVYDPDEPVPTPDRTEE
jgi:hypothetical protein